MSVLQGIPLPHDLVKLVSTLETAGYKTYLVGGCMRDILFDETPHDYDVVTQADPTTVKSLFSPTIDTGIKHGTVTVIMPDGQYEVTTMRKDGAYKDHRHPDTVEFVDDITEDLARRDFTMNAIAGRILPDHDDSEGTYTIGLIDPFCGYKDLCGGFIKCVGDPDKRFQEDPLRILRALRFAVSYDLNIDVKTGKAIHANVQMLNGLSAERVQSELRKMFTAGYDHDDFGLLLFDYIDVLEEIIPELHLGRDFEQHSPYHIYTVQNHILKSVMELNSTVKKLPEFSATIRCHWFELCITMLLHDIAKPVCYTVDESGTGHFYGHAEKSAELADTILRRLKFSNEERERIVLLIQNHDRQFEPTVRCANRLLAALGPVNAQLLMAVRFADLYAHGVDYNKFGAMNAMRKAEITYLYLAVALLEKRKFSVHDLLVNGRDLIEMGYTPGPLFSSCLNYLFNKVVDGELPNQNKILLQNAKIYMEEHTT